MTSTRHLRQGGAAAASQCRWCGDQISHFQLVTDTLQLAQLLGLAEDQKGTEHAHHS